MKFIDNYTAKWAQPMETDSQIVQVPLDNMDWAARKSAMPGSIKNSQTIKHVKNGG